MEIRWERPDDIGAICSITTAAFKEVEHSRQTEAAIVNALRAADVLTVSFVAVDGGEIVGHVAFSPITIDGEDKGWYGLGPVSVRPDRQRKGIGQVLIREGLAQLKRAGANGCVVLGDPAYYERFGFASDPALRYQNVPAEYFRRITFAGDAPTGRVSYHSGFDAT